MTGQLHITPGTGLLSLLCNGAVAADQDGVRDWTLVAAVAGQDAHFGNAAAVSMARLLLQARWAGAQSRILNTPRSFHNVLD